MRALSSARVLPGLRELRAMLSARPRTALRRFLVRAAHALMDAMVENNVVIVVSSRFHACARAVMMSGSCTLTHAPRRASLSSAALSVASSRLRMLRPGRSGGGEEEEGPVLCAGGCAAGSVWLGATELSLSIVTTRR